MMQMKESLNEERSQFSKKKIQLNIDVEHQTKLQAFTETKLQQITPREPDTNTKKTSKMFTHKLKILTS